MVRALDSINKFVYKHARACTTAPRQKNTREVRKQWKTQHKTTQKSYTRYVHKRKHPNTVAGILWMMRTTQSAKKLRPTGAVSSKNTYHSVPKYKGRLGINTNTQRSLNSGQSGTRHLVLRTYKERLGINVDAKRSLHFQTYWWQVPYLVLRHTHTYTINYVLHWTLYIILLCTL